MALYVSNSIVCLGYMYCRSLANWRVCNVTPCLDLTTSLLSLYSPHHHSPFFYVLQLCSTSFSSISSSNPTLYIPLRNNPEAKPPVLGSSDDGRHYGEAGVATPD